jgi:hypothetical protein
VRCNCAVDFYVKSRCRTRGTHVVCLKKESKKKSEFSSHTSHVHKRKQSLSALSNRTNQLIN